MTCTSHCQLIIDGAEFTVLWEFAICQSGNRENEIQDPNDNPGDQTSGHIGSDDDSHESDEVVMHTLPFKVLGSCHKKHRQVVLEQAHDYLYEYNRPVCISLEREPDNPYDSNAIAVFLQTIDEFEIVGYIASELTQYVIPSLGHPDFRASVKDIRFRTTYMMVGFYLSIELTKRGLWHKEVIKASKSIK